MKVILLLFLLISSNALAESNLCIAVNNFVEKKWDEGNEFKTNVKWNTGGYSYFNSYMGRTFKETYIEFTHLDIDNDGIQDTVIRSWGGIGGHLGQSLVIVKNQIVDLSFKGAGYSHKVYDFGSEELNMIHSYPPWPYKEMGIDLAEMNPFFFEGKYYIVLSDTEKRGYMLSNYSKSKIIETKGHLSQVYLPPVCSKKI